MFGNYLKTAYRNLLRSKLTTFINAIGLSIGIASVLLIALYISYEFSYDSFHADKDQIYRVSIKAHTGEGSTIESAQFVPPLSPAMYEEFPEVIDFTRISISSGDYISYEDVYTRAEEICYADSNFFRFFSFELLEGDKNSLLQSPYSIVLSEKLAINLFGEEEAIGKTVELFHRNYTVTGVAADVPGNSTIQYDALLSFSTLYSMENMYMGWDGGNRYYHYVRLSDQVDPETVHSRFPNFLWEHINRRLEQHGVSLSASLQNIGDLHIHYNDYNPDIITDITIFSVIAFFILIIAVTNFINLYTARIEKRSQETGIRKVLGAGRLQLIQQSVIETLMLGGFSFLIALLLVEASAPFFESGLGIVISAFTIPGVYYAGATALGLFFIGLAVGMYPALLLSSYKPSRILRGLRIRRGKPIGRNVLVIVQYTISIALIICTILLYSQVTYMNSFDLGFTKDQKMTLPIRHLENADQIAVLKSELLKLPGINGVASSSDIPYNGFTSNGYKPEGIQNSELISVLDVDEDFLPVYNIDVVRGRNFSKDFPSDKEAYIVNTAFVKKYGYEEPIGKEVERNGFHQIIGVVEDFHFASLHKPVEPLIITLKPDAGKYSVMTVSMRSNDYAGLIDNIEKVWKDVAGATPFEYSFLDEMFSRLYEKERVFQHLFLGFSLLAIIIALLGLFSLILFATEQRTKEIGIRKVLGAKASGIIMLVSKDFTLLIALANIIAFPAAYYFMSNWLENFAYRISITPFPFAAAAGAAFILSIALIAAVTYRAAAANPVDSLRRE